MGDTEKRNTLATAACMWVPEVATELKIAERCINEGNTNDALTAIREAQEHVEQLRKAFEEACIEMRGDFGSHDREAE